MYDDPRAHGWMNFFLVATLATFILVFVSVKWPGALSHVARASAHATADFFGDLVQKLQGSL